MDEDLLTLKNLALAQIIESKSVDEIEHLRQVFLGRRGKLAEITKKIPKLPPEEKALAGRTLNEVKRTIGETLTQKRVQLEQKTTNQIEWVDFTLPGIRPHLGHSHLISQTINEISKIFEKIGFKRASYPEVEWDYYAFEGLNMPKNHPARDEWETFFIKDLDNPKYGTAILTPHTSSGQLREMERRVKPPMRMLNIAKCYRRQSDISHAPMFYQFEGLLINKDVNIAHLKGTLDWFAKEYFGRNREIRIRPFHFQFTEPSFEVDVSCIVCRGRGCRVCKEGWLELGGAGMIHPTVLKNGGIDPAIYTGFAFGWGVERLLMMKYSLDDIRLLFAGDLRFLNQF